MIDPMTAITTISAGLKLVDQFRELALRFMGSAPKAPPARAEQSGDVIEIKHNGQVTEEVKAEALRLDHWDDVRYRALETRTRLSWTLFNELDTQLPLLAGLQLAQVKLQMENTKQALCVDFWEMVGIYERALGVGLPDHYKLFEVCDGAPPA